MDRGDARPGVELFDPAAGGRDPVSGPFHPDGDPQPVQQADHSWTFEGASFDNEWQAMRWLENDIPLLDRAVPPLDGVPVEDI